MIRIRNPVGVAQGLDLDRHQSERKGRIRIRIKVSGSATLPLQGREGIRCKNDGYRGSILLRRVPTARTGTIQACKKDGDSIFFPITPYWYPHWGTSTGTI